MSIFNLSFKMMRLNNGVGSTRCPKVAKALSTGMDIKSTQYSELVTEAVLLAPGTGSDDLGGELEASLSIL